MKRFPIYLVALLIAATPQICTASLTKTQVKQIISETLSELKDTSHVSRELLTLTVAVETDMGRSCINDKILIGIFQIEPATLKDTHKWAVRTIPKAKHRLNSLKNKSRHHYQAAIALFCYKRRGDIPKIHFVDGRLTEASIAELAFTWKFNYNTYKGKGNVIEAMQKYKKYS